MHEKAQQESNEDWVDLLREELPLFDPSRATLCDVQLQNYYARYRLSELPEDVSYSAGFHRLKDLQLFLQFFSRRGAKGTVVLVHGYTDHSGLYRHVIKHLLMNRWNVFTYDLPGHGVSTGEPLLIDRFDHYVIQLQQLVSVYRAYLIGPVVMMGQSMGGSVVLSFLKASSQQQKTAWSVQGAILLAPMIRPADYDWMSRLYPWVFWWLKRFKRRFAESSHDQAFLDFRSQEDPLQHRYIPLKWIGAMLNWVKQTEQSNPCEDDVLVIQGTGDQTVNWPHNLEVLKRLLPSAQWQLIDDAKHHLVNESECYRQQVFASIDDYLAQRQQTL